MDVKSPACALFVASRILLLQRLYYLLVGTSLILLTAPCLYSSNLASNPVPATCVNAVAGV